MWTEIHQSGLNELKLTEWTKVDQNGLNWTIIDQNATLIWLNKRVITINITFQP